MTLSLDEVRHIARLARLDLSDEELERYRGQLAAILAHVAQLAELDTTGIQPTSAVLPPQSVLRADTPRAGLTPADLAKNAPDWDQDQFRVPPILD